MKQDKTVKELLVEMFRRVGLEVSSYAEVEEWAGANGDEWYRKRTWTDAQEQEFKKWAVDKMRKAFKCTKKTAEAEYSWFNLMWGWRVDTEISGEQSAGLDGWKC